MATCWDLGSIGLACMQEIQQLAAFLHLTYGTFFLFFFNM